MNLQLCAPYKKCPFKCPMCIASKAPKFRDAYHTQTGLYMYKLISAIKKYDISTVVLTGDTEPTLQREWLGTVCKELKHMYPEVSIELQTHVYNNPNLYCRHLDMVCYSITTVEDLKLFLRKVKAKMIPDKSRVVILATEELIDYLDKVTIDFNSEQITFKILQNSAYKDSDKDAYVFMNSVYRNDKRLGKLVRYYKRKLGKSVVVDKNCQKAKGRYLIYREDGSVYDSWNSLTPIRY